MGQRLGRRGSNTTIIGESFITNATHFPPYRKEPSTHVITAEATVNRPSVVITIRMLKMEPVDHNNKTNNNTMGTTSSSSSSSAAAATTTKVASTALSSSSSTSTLNKNICDNNDISKMNHISNEQNSANPTTNKLDNNNVSAMIVPPTVVAATAPVSIQTPSSIDIRNTNHQLSNLNINMAPSIVPTNDDSLSLRIAAAAAAATSSNGHFLKHISCYDQHNLNNLHNNINNNRSGNNHSNNNNNNLNELLNASANKFSDCIVNSNVLQQQQQQQNHHSVISKCENNVVFSENNRNMLTAAAAVGVTAPSTIGPSVECCSHGRKISDVSSPQSQQSIITPSPGTTCNSCNRKSKGKLCKMCRSNDNNKSTVAGESGEVGKDRSKSSKKNNWGIRFKRSNKQSTSSAAAKTTSEQTANKTYTCLCTAQSQSCDATGDATSLPLISAPTTCTTSNNSIVEDTTSHILDTNQTQNLLSSSNNPTQLRNAALQFFPAHQGALMSSAAVGNTVAPIPTTTASDSGGNNNNNHNINAQSASVLQQQHQQQQQQQNHLNNQLLQRAATAAFYGNGGGNVIFLSMNPSTPQARISDIARLHPDEYPIEDCDERARIQRAYEIAEGVEPPPGYRSNVQPQPNVHQPNTNTPQAPATAAAWQMLQLQCNESLQNILNNRNSFQHFMLQNIMPPDELPRIHSQVDFIHCLVPDLKKITSCGFYWGKMDRYEAERLLEGKPEGTFLLRDSAQEEFLFSVSFRKYGRSLHARIEQFNHKFSFDSHDPCVYTASTVTGLLEHYKDPTCVMFFEPMLTIPLNRNFVFSLQQLCRATIVSSTTYDGINEFALPQTLKSYLKEYHYKQRVRVRRLDEITPMLIPSLEGF